jgi:hypothetical protein
MRRPNLSLNQNQNRRRKRKMIVPLRLLARPKSASAPSAPKRHAWRRRRPRNVRTRSAKSWKPKNGPKLPKWPPRQNA